MAERRRGFTLIEALAALLLVGMVMPIAMQALSLTLRLAGAAARTNTAVMLAESAMHELLSRQTWDSAEMQGTFDDAGFGECDPDGARAGSSPYRWEATLGDWIDSSLGELTVRVTWMARGREHEVTLTTLVPSGES